MQPRPHRYPIRRPVQYFMRTPSGPILGEGHTRNISRRGVLFEPTDDLIVGRKIELLVSMDPAMAAGEYVTLFVQGVTVRKDDGGTAVSIRKHRLRPLPQEEIKLR